MKNPQTSQTTSAIARLLIALALLCAFCAQAFAQTPGGTTISNQASATYSDGTNAYSTVSNTVTVTVSNVSGLAITPDAGSNPTVVAGQTAVLFNFTVTNTGGADAVGVLPAFDDHSTAALAVLALGLASLARYGSQKPHWLRLYTYSLDMAARLTYAWALLGAMVLFVLLPFQSAGAAVWVFVVLAIALLPLVQPLPRAPTIRGIGVALLLSAGVVSVLASAGWYTYERCLFILWAYALWSLGNFALPRFNASWPRWAIAPDIWPWLGLLLVGSALTIWGLPWLAAPWAAAAPLGMYLAAVALYLFLLLRNSAWGGWPWIAVGTLTCAGLVCNAAASWALATGLVLRLPSVSMAIPWGRAGGEIVWANMLLLGVLAWRRYGPAVACQLGWQAQSLTLPLLVWPSVVLGLWLLYLAVWDALGILAYAGTAVSLLHGAPTVLLGLLLSVSYAHVVWLHSAGWTLHSGIAARHQRIMRRRPKRSIIRESASAPSEDTDIHANRRAIPAPSRLKLLPIHGDAMPTMETAKPT